jgi:hypothetical protein
MDVFLGRTRPTLDQPDNCRRSTWLRDLSTGNLEQLLSGIPGFGTAQLDMVSIQALDSKRDWIRCLPRRSRRFVAGTRSSCSPTASERGSGADSFAACDGGCTSPPDRKGLRGGCSLIVDSYETRECTTLPVSLANGAKGIHLRGVTEAVEALYDEGIWKA